MKKHCSSRNFYQTMASNGAKANGRYPHPVFVKQKTTWMRFLLFYLFGHEATAVPKLQPIRVQNNRKPYQRRY